MSFGLSISRSSKKKNILSCGSNLGQLVESEALSFGGSNSVSGLSCESKGSNSNSFRDIQESDIIGDGPNNSNNSIVELGFSFNRFLCIPGKKSGNSGYGDWVSVKSGLIKSFVNGLIEF